MGSRSVFVLSIAGLIAVAVLVAVALDTSSPAIAVAAAIAGSGMYIAHRNARRSEGAQRRAGDVVGDYPVRLSAQRVAPGKAMQVTFSKANRAVHAEGLLCAAPGRLHFVPSKDKDAAKAWEGDVDAVSVERTLSESTIRVTSSAGKAQFVVPMPPSQIEQQLAPYVRVEST